MQAKSDGSAPSGSSFLASKAHSLDHRGPVLSLRTENVYEHYTLGKKLGEGHFGATFACTGKATGRACAMKRLSKARLLMLGTPLEEVQREVGILYHLAGHPNIVEILDAFEDSRFVYIIMEQCAGGELYDRIVEKGGYSERDAARLVRTIVSVIGFCHSHGVVHRDLKPENFLFLDASEESPLKAIDFGLSLFFKRGEPLSAGMAGSPLYLAPEMVASNGRHYTEAIDVWSAGVIMYMLLSGYCPFPTDLPTMDELFNAILYDRIDYLEPPWPSISAGAKDLLQKMLTRDPTRRISAFAALSHPWLCQTDVVPDTPMDPTVVLRLRSYSKMSRFRKLAARIVAQHLSEEQILGMKEIFQQLDSDKSGTITLEEMTAGLRQMGATMCEAEIQSLFSAADEDGSNTLELDEFLAATLGHFRTNKEENLVFAFQYLDKDGSGQISLDELQQACLEFGFSTADLPALFAEVDTNQDNLLDYKEFVALMCKQSTSSIMGKQSSLGKDRSLTGQIEEDRLARSMPRKF